MPTIKKDTLSFRQTLDNKMYKEFYTMTKNMGATVQSRIRLLVANDLKTNVKK